MAKFMFTQDTPFVGTAKAFSDNKIYLNGKALDVVGVGALARHGLLEDAGDGPKPVRGRTPRLYRAYSHANMQFTRDDADAAPVVAQANTQADDSDIVGVVDTDPQA